MKRDVNEMMITFQSEDDLSCGDNIMWLKNTPFQLWYGVILNTKEKLRYIEERDNEKDICPSSTQDFVKSNQVKPLDEIFTSEQVDYLQPGFVGLIVLKKQE